MIGDKMIFQNFLKIWKKERKKDTVKEEEQQPQPTEPGSSPEQ